MAALDHNVCMFDISALLDGAQHLICQQLGEANDRVQRRAQLVTHVGNEVGLRALGGQSLFLRAQFSRSGHADSRHVPQCIDVEMPGPEHVLFAQAAQMRSSNK